MQLHYLTCEVPGGLEEKAANVICVVQHFHSLGDVLLANCAIVSFALVVQDILYEKTIVSLQIKKFVIDASSKKWTSW